MIHLWGFPRTVLKALSITNGLTAFVNLLFGSVVLTTRYLVYPVFCVAFEFCLVVALVCLFVALGFEFGVSINVKFDKSRVRVAFLIEPPYFCPVAGFANYETL